MLRLARFVEAPSNLSRSRGRASAGILVLAAMVALAFFLDLGRPAFWDPGESRYAETVREMMTTGNWIRPTLDFTRYYDKPPGFFWLVAAAFRLLGQNEWAARVPSALAAVATIVMVVAFAWTRIGWRAALGTGAILTTTIQYVVLGRSVRMDMLLTLLTTATLLQAFRLLGERPAAGTTRGEGTSWPLYVCPALGILIKGPVAMLLPLMILATFLMATRTAFRWERVRPGAIAILALVGLAAWYVALAVYAPDYLWTFLVQHNLGRFLGRALAGHREPIWFYCWILPLTFLPWTLFLPDGLRYAYRRARRGDRLSAYLLLWCLVPFVFFSLSRAKLATYLLPIFPALALLVAVYLDRVLRAPTATRARALLAPTTAWTMLMGAIALGLPIVVAAALPDYRRAGLPALLLGVFALLGWRAIRRAQWRVAPVLVTAGTLAMYALFYRVGGPVVDDFSSLRDAARVAADLPANATVFAYKTRGHSFMYYGGRSLYRVRSPADAAEMLSRPGATAVLVKRRHVEKIRQHLTAPAWIWWQSPSGRVLIANVPRPNEPGTPLVPTGTVPTSANSPAC